MRKTRLLPFISFLAFFLFGCPFTPVKDPGISIIEKGDFFPAIPLKTPPDPQDRQYLGLSERQTFTLDQINGDLVLIEIMNVYCSSCRTQAPIYNKLYEMIESDPKTKGRIKILAIAAGNGDEEIKGFRERYAVPFPVVPDPEFAAHRAIGSSPTPFSVYVRPLEATGGAGRVVGTHLGTIFDREDLFGELVKMMTMDLSALEGKGRAGASSPSHVEPILSEKEVEARVKIALETTNGNLEQFERITLKDSTTIYAAVVKGRDGSHRLFAEAVSRSVPCDVCHDAHFIYVFDSKGKVVGFAPIQLTKYGNEPWDESDLSKIRSRVLGRYIFKPVLFDPKVDAVASATITAAVIFDSVSHGEAILEELRRKGLIQ